MAAQHGGRRDEKGRNIQVVVRCRPFNTMEHKSSHGVVECDVARKEVVVKTGGPLDKASRKTYSFDMVFGAAAKQIEVYRSVVCPILDEVIMGYNCTVFAYGQTGTGKTFTMEGERSPDDQFTWEEDPLAGIIPRTLHQIFEKLTENGTEFSVKVSLLEIYNEELFDLLSPSEDVSERLQLFDDPRNKRGVVVKGLEEVTVHNKDQVYQILERGAAKRKTASTLMNAYSSRSHSVFSVTIHMKEMTLDGEELVKIGKLNLVDLAGSENIGRSGAVDKRAREAGNINQSLLTLGRVITALVEKRPHVPYRESKLTRILQDSLGGRTKTSIIATVSPSSSNVEETLSTLEYASRAKNIMNKPEVNQKLTKRTLIKEYTEEIERLKRDLAAAREKNGIYLSSENYETMMSQISAQDCHISEYSDRIAAMEEELKKVSELFVESKEKLQRCAEELEQKQQSLEQTTQSLEETKVKLSEEEFISTELQLAQENLYNISQQLLTTVDASTSDVSGLHGKLDRKKKVEQHNQQMQQSFAQRMEGSLGSIQQSVQLQGSHFHRTIHSYSQTVDALLSLNTAAVKGALTSVEALVSGVKDVVAKGVASCQEKLTQQQDLCLKDKQKVLELLDEHRRDMEEVLVLNTLKGLPVIQELSDTLRTTMETQKVLVDKVEAMKEVGAFYVGVVQDLAQLREETVQNMRSHQAADDRLRDGIRAAQERQRLATSRTLQCLQEQLNQLSVEAEQDWEQLHATSKSHSESLQFVQQGFSSGCSALEQRAASQAALLSSTSCSLASALRLSLEQSRRSVEQLSGCCSGLQASVSGLVERDLERSSRVQQQAEDGAGARRSHLNLVASEAEALQQGVRSSCSEQLRSAEEQLSSHSQEVRRRLLEAQSQSCAERTQLDQQQLQLLAQLEASQKLLSGFLQEELQQDVPTGTTPQRRDFSYPTSVAKSRSRCELLEGLRIKQVELQTALEEEPPQEEGEEEREEDRTSQADQDSLEDDLSMCSRRDATESSFIDENLVFNQSKRLPFFKKKSGKKEVKVPGRPKTETEASVTPSKSKLPLRCQN
ncbi:kinesin-like protein KIF11 [Synchiropus splendidus]|uniref:kinesin-like protein KIF11 n=1 Tax=Synchiropus splendidus TaxID=270530 RepID=UPI00237DAD6E|nr:kinesin-like protein KIF11 [Synchiropus splendidus]